MVQPTIKKFYLSPFLQGQILDLRFDAEQVKDHRPGPISEIFAVALGNHYQLAFSGYKDNIDAFLAATAKGETTKVFSSFFDIPFVKSTLPLQYPRLVVCLDKVPAANLPSVLDLMKQSGTVAPIENIKSRKGLYTWSTPNIEHVLQLEPAMNHNVPTIEGCCSAQSAIAFYHVMTMVELFLRTNTYPAYSDPSSNTYKNPPGVLGSQIDAKNIVTRLHKSPLNADDDKTRTSEFTFGEGEKAKLKTGVFLEVNNPDEAELVIKSTDMVYFAKPGQKTASYVSPTSVPALPGMLFPYFDGMNTADKKYILYAVSRYYRRCFGKDFDSKFSEFREHIHGVIGHKVGLIVTHIVKGMELALESQTRMLPIFSGENYRGFVILGAKWRLHYGNQVFVPESASELQSTLVSVKTHTSQLEDIAALLREKGTIMDVASVKSAYDLSQILKDFKIASSPSKEELAFLKRLDTAVSSLDFGTRPIQLNPDNFVKALLDILNPTNSLEKQYILFPEPKHYRLFALRHGVVLSRFGIDCPSFANPKTSVAYSVNDDAFKVTDETKFKVACAGRKIIVSQVNLPTATRDFSKFLEDGILVQESKERSSEYKNMNIKSENAVFKVIRVLSNFTFSSPEKKDKSKKQRTETEVALYLTALGLGGRPVVNEENTPVVSTESDMDDDTATIYGRMAE